MAKISIINQRLEININSLKKSAGEMAAASWPSYQHGSGISWRNISG